MPFVKAVLGADCSLNYTGCVVSRPGDTNQNWHIDGMHVDKSQHASPDRIIVFCALTDLDDDTGCTEFVPRSHVESRVQAKFHRVSAWPRARHYVHAGTPIAMDYRLWHRGLANVSKKDRFLLYCTYQTAEGRRAIEETGGDRAAFRKR